MLGASDDGEQDRHACCSFTAYALPQLRAFGWQVEIAPDYPFQVVDGDPPFYAAVDADSGQSTRDWFSLELGIEIEVQSYTVPAYPRQPALTGQESGLSALDAWMFLGDRAPSLRIVEPAGRDLRARQR